MKAENNSCSIKEENWNCFPNICQLSQYLPRSDLIQLSLTCSESRNKLNSVIFRNLELIKGGEIIRARPNISTKRNQWDILLDVLEEDYLDKYDFVRHCALWEQCSKPFVTKLFSMFKNITKLEIYSSGENIDGSCLINILEPLKKLEVLIFDCKLIDSIDAGSVPKFKLPTCLKVLDVTGYSINSLNFGPIENINGEYAQLKRVTIINNNMLASISASINSLTEVTIFQEECLCPKLLTQLFSSNPQLKKISISLMFIDSDVINSILSLSKLVSLNITEYFDENINELDNLTFNTSIKHLYIEGDITQNILLPILSSTESLHTLEFSKYDFWNFDTIDWSSYNGEIPLFVLDSVYFTGHNLDILLNSPIFSKLKFINSFELDFYISNFGFDDLENWKVIQDNPLSKSEFYLEKIRN